MSAPIPTMPELAAEAEFQLLAAADQLEWLAALAGAIQLDHEQNSGRSAKRLVELAKYLADSGFSGVYAYIQVFKDLSEGAPQNAEVPNRGEHGDGETLGRRIQASRERAGLSQADLASLVGVSQAAISGIESGVSKRSSYLPELARACKVDIAWLAFGPEGAQ